MSINENEEASASSHLKSTDARAWSLVYSYAKEKGIVWDEGKDGSTRDLLDLIYQYKGQ